MFVQEGGQSVRGGIGKKEILTAKHFIEDYAKGKNIGTRVQGTAAHLLGRHVAHGAENDSRRGTLRKSERTGIRCRFIRALHLGRSKLQNFYPTRFPYQ